MCAACMQHCINVVKGHSVCTARRSVTINFNSYVSGAHEAGLVGRLVGYRAMPEVISFAPDNSI